jgi:hypothetical protein
MPYPDYHGGSLVNLMSRLARELGAEGHLYPALEHPALPDLSAYHNIVLFIIDGLGASYLNAHPGFLQAHQASELTSVFPTTTASAITTFMTGLAPQQHGLTGWFTYLKELGAVTAVLPCQLRGSHELLSDRGIDVSRLYGHIPFFDTLKVPSTVLAPEWIIDSPFNISHSGHAHRQGYTDLTSMLENLRNILRAGERQYVYAYWPDFDRLSHQYGNASGQVAQHFQELDTRLAQFIETIAGTRSLILVTADHGFIDTTPERLIDLHAHPVLQECLSLPLSGEPRLAYCYLHPHKTDSFIKYVREEFTEQMELIESRSLIEQEAFGFGEAHPQLAQRVGDYTLIMKDNYVIKDWIAGEQPFFHYGVHGGTSQLEMQVPLILLTSD